MDNSVVLVILVSINLAVGVFTLARMRWPLEVVDFDSVLKYFKLLDSKRAGAELRDIMDRLNITPPGVVDIVKSYSATPEGRSKLVQSFIAPLSAALEDPDNPDNVETLRRIRQVAKVVEDNGGSLEAVQGLLDQAETILEDS